LTAVELQQIVLVHDERICKWNYGASACLLMQKNDWLQPKHNFMEPSLGRWNIPKGRNKWMAVALLV
jgi:hypothetical protein